MYGQQNIKIAYLLVNMYTIISATRFGL